MFRRHVLLTIGVFAVVAGLCAFLARFVERFERRRFFDEQATALINQIQSHPGDKTAYVHDLARLNKEMRLPLQVELLAEGEVHESFGPSLSVPFDEDGKKQTLRISMQPPPQMPPPPSEGFAHGPPPGPFPGGPFRGPPRSFIGPPLVTFVTLFIVLVLASLLSVHLIYRSFREKAEMAREVLGRMQRGDLKARFTTSKRDEAYQMFELFNQMAAEIERLVERLRDDERTRIQLLQELAHDLRTPVSSLKNAIETIRFDEEKIDAPTRAEIKNLAYQETEYLSRLVDDLLFLALMMEPKYKVESVEIPITALISDQMSAAKVSYPNVNSDFNISSEKPDLRITGNSQLLRRLLRNAFENAFSFAKSRVQTTLSEVPGGIQIVIRDDGPGLSPEALAGFGHKKTFSRYRSAVIGGRPSVGLGSVILKTIATAHGGEVKISNQIDAGGKILGAELVIFLATSLAAAA